MKVNAKLDGVNVALHPNVASTLPFMKQQFIVFGNSLNCAQFKGVM